MAHEDELELHAVFNPDVDVRALWHRLTDAGAAPEHIHVLSPLPLEQKGSDCIAGIPMYILTVIAGLVGISVGVFFAAGTAAMYPLMTGGKPIVAPPIVGIISYETMMLVAIVTTFVAMLLKIRHTNSVIHFRDARIDEGLIAVLVRAPMFGPMAGVLQDVLQHTGAIDVSISIVTGGREAPPHRARQAGSVMLVCVLAGSIGGCSRDMQEQPSYQSQEAPRLHSPQGSMPRVSRRFRPVVPASIVGQEEHGATVFRINCIHCHGANGNGDGPVAAYLKERPANLSGDNIRAMSEQAIYRVVTEGKDMMPSFQGELSADDRLAVARFVASLSRPSPRQRNGEDP